MKGGQELTILLIGVCSPMQLMVHTQFHVLFSHQIDVNSRLSSSSSCAARVIVVVLSVCVCVSTLILVLQATRPLIIDNSGFRTTRA